MTQPVILRFLGDTTDLERAMKKAAAEASIFESAMKKFSNLNTAMVQSGRSLTRGVTIPVAAAAAGAVYLSVKFHDAMTKIGALTNVGTANVGKLSKEVLALAKTVPIGPVKLAEGLYFLESAGLTSAQAMSALKASAKASAVGLGDFGDISQLVSSIMKVWPKEMTDATKAVDILIKTVKEGKGEPEALAKFLGKVASAAAQSGVSLNEVGAALAAASNKGIDFARGTTSLGQILNQIEKPTAKAKKTLGEFGLTTKKVQETLHNKGLLAALELLDGKLGSNREAWRRVFPNIEAVRMLAALTGDQMKDTERVFANMSNTTGELGNAMDEMSKSPGFRLKQMLSNLQVVGIKFGDTITPLVLKVSDAFGKLLDKADAMSPAQKKMAADMLLVAAAVGPLLYSVGKLGKALEFVAVHPVLAGVGLLAAGFAVAYQKSEPFRTSVNHMAAEFRAFAVDKLQALWVGLGHLATSLSAIAASPEARRLLNDIKEFGQSVGDVFKPVYTGARALLGTFKGGDGGVSSATRFLGMVADFAENPAVQTAFAAFVGYAVGLRAYAAAAALAAAAQTALNLAMTRFTGVAAGAAVLGAATALAAASVVIYHHSSTIRKAWDDMWASFEAGHPLTGINQLRQGVGVALTDPFIHAFQDIKAKMPGWWAQITTPGSDWGVAMSEGIKKPFRAAWDWIKSSSKDAFLPDPNAFAGYDGALDQVKIHADDVREAHRLASGAVTNFGASATAATGPTTGLTAAMRDQLDVTQDMAGVNISVIQSELNYKSSLEAASASVKTNKAHLDDNTAAGKLNMQALINQAGAANATVKAMQAQGAGYADVAAKGATLRADLIATATKMGASASQAEAYANKLLAIPSRVNTEVVTKYTTNGELFRAPGTGIPKGAAAPQKRALGGIVEGPRYPVDTVPLLATGGEFVVNPEETAKNRALLESINAGKGVPAPVLMPTATTAGASAGSALAAGIGAATPAAVSGAVKLINSTNAALQAGKGKLTKVGGSLGRGVIDPLTANLKSSAPAYTVTETIKRLLAAYQSGAKKVATEQTQFTKAAQRLADAQKKLRHDQAAKKPNKYTIDKDKTAVARDKAALDAARKELEAAKKAAAAEKAAYEAEVKYQKALEARRKAGAALLAQADSKLDWYKKMTSPAATSELAKSSYNMANAIRGQFADRDGEVPDAVADMLDSLKSMGDEIEQAFQGFYNSFQGGLVSELGSTGAMAGGMKAFLNGRIEDLKAFTQDISYLSGIGVPRSLLKEMAAAGLGALPLVESLANSAPEDISAVVALQAQVDALAVRAATAAEAVTYGLPTGPAAGPYRAWKPPQDTAAPTTVIENLNVNTTTNADPQTIANEIGWIIRTL